MKKYSGMNLENVKTSNQLAILRLLNNSGPLPRKDIAEKIGLTAASITLISSDLLDEGIIVEAGEVSEGKRAGRKKILIDINSEYKKALCIEIEFYDTYLSLTDFKGNVIACEKIDTDRAGDPVKFLERAADLGQRMLWDNGISKDKLLGVGVTLPGMVDQQKGISLGKHGIWRERLFVREILSKRLGDRIIVENNLQAAAEYEIHFGSGRHDENIYLLKWGPGVGSAIILGDRMYMGSGKQAGELGHVTLVKDGRICSCGRKGCLESYISTHAILSDIEEKTGNRYSYREGISHLGDSEISEIMHEKMDALAMCLRNVVSIIDPSRVIVMGHMFEVPGILDGFRECYRLYEINSADDFIIRSDLRSNGGHIGALAQLINTYTVM